MESMRHEDEVQMTRDEAKLLLGLLDESWEPSLNTTERQGWAMVLLASDYDYTLALIGNFMRSNPEVRPTPEEFTAAYVALVDWAHADDTPAPPPSPIELARRNLKSYRPGVSR